MCKMEISVTKKNMVQSLLAGATGACICGASCIGSFCQQLLCRPNDPAAAVALHTRTTGWMAPLFTQYSNRTAAEWQQNLVLVNSQTPNLNTVLVNIPWPQTPSTTHCRDECLVADEACPSSLYILLSLPTIPDGSGNGRRVWRSHKITKAQEVNSQMKGT